MTIFQLISSGHYRSDSTVAAFRLAVAAAVVFFGSFAPIFTTISTPIFGAGSIDIWTANADFELKDFPVLDLLESRSRIDGFTFLLDRRIDPTIPITYSNSSIPLAQGLAEALATVKLEVYFLDSFLYVGPQGSVGTLLLDRALRQEKLAVSSNPNLGSLRKRISLDGEDGCVPSELLTQAGKKIGFTWEKIRTMPFDCWRPLHIPPIPAEDIFSFLLIGFDVSWRIDDQEPVLYPVSRKQQANVTVNFTRDELSSIDRQAYTNIEWESVIGTVKGTGSFQELADIQYKIALERMRGELDSHKEKSAGGARGSQESPSSVKRSVRSGGRSRQRGAEQEAIRTLSGELRQIPLETVFESFRSQLGLTCLLDPSAENAGVSLQTRVTCQFSQADQRKAVKILADALGLSVKIKGDTAIFIKK